MRPGILVLLETVARLWAAEDLYVARVRRVACFDGGGAQGSATKRRCTLGGGVAISRKWITCNGCALKMNPREFSSAGIPSSVARATMNGVSVDEASKSCLACWSGSLLPLPGNSIDGPAVDERWMLKSNTAPSSPLTAAKLRASATRSPSVASPSVMLMTIGGNPFGCSWHQVWVILVASLSAAHIGVPPFPYGSNQTGNLTVWSITPPAPSSDFFTLSSMRNGLLANSLIGTKARPLSSPPSAGLQLSSL